MDTLISPNFQPQPSSSTRRFPLAKILGIVALVVIFIELIWAGLTLSKANNISSDKKIPTGLFVSSPPKETTATLSLEGPETVNLNTDLTVTIIQSNTTAVDGTDLIIKYDPNLVAVVSVEKPVKTLPFYPEYLVNSASKGEIRLSGLSSLKPIPKAQGPLGTIIFRAKKAGSANFSIDFQPKSTVHSNIVSNTTGENILSSVKNLKVNIK